MTSDMKEQIYKIKHKLKLEKNTLANSNLSKKNKTLIEEFIFSGFKGFYTCLLLL